MKRVVKLVGRRSEGNRGPSVQPTNKQTTYPFCTGERLEAFHQLLIFLGLLYHLLRYTPDDVSEERVHEGETVFSGHY